METKQKVLIEEIKSRKSKQDAIFIALVIEHFGHCYVNSNIFLVIHGVFPGKAYR